MGNTVANMQLLLYTAAILRSFVVLPPHRKPVCTDTHMRIAHRLKNFQCVFQPRDFDAEAKAKAKDDA